MQPGDRRSAVSSPARNEFGSLESRQIATGGNRFHYFEVDVL